MATNKLGTYPEDIEVTNLERLSNVQVSRPIWKGPEDNSKNGGITQSLLGKFLACPNRFKALVVDNLKPRRKFSHRMEYGTLFHLCDELFSSGKDWSIGLKEHVDALLIQYPFDQVDILKWWRVCQIQFPIYLDYWNAHHEDVSRTSLLQEQLFHLPYKLPSGRTVYLRGRWDAVELVDGVIWLCENKTKGDVDPVKIERRLKYDLQTQFYLVALREHQKLGNLQRITSVLGDTEIITIKGVRYNIIRRPLSGGKGTIKQTKNETIDQYYDRLSQYIKDEPETYFFRWQSEILPSDIEAFEKNTLIPCLERLCYWWDGINGTSRYNQLARHWSSLDFTMPFGVPHITDEYGTEYDEFIMSGSTIGLEKCTEIFPELNGGE